jgi:taurine dioxygenase
MSFVVNPLGPGAAEIIGLDCARLLADSVFRAVRQEFLEHPVLVFRNQTLSAPQLAAFGRRFGKLESYGNPPAAGTGAAKSQTAALRQTGARETPDQMLYQSPDDPDVLIMTNEIRDGLPVIGIVDNAETWHSDASHKSEPCQAIIVHVIHNPVTGGDTEFCDLRAVYDALTPDIRSELDGHIAIHHWSKSLNPRFKDALDPAACEEGERIARMIPEMRQPVVRTHPETGRPSLYLSPRFTLHIDDVPRELSDTLLNGLFALMEEPRFYYRHESREKDLVIWDNRCLNHRVRSYAAQDIRCRYRVTVAGDRPFFRAPAIAAA